MNLATEKRKINEIIARDYEHEQPDQGPRAKAFGKAFKALLKKIFPTYEVVNYSHGCGCEASGFLKNAEGKLVYFRTNDYRYNVCGRWDQRILIRTAESEKDYTGGANHTADLEQLEEEVNRLFKTQSR